MSRYLETPSTKIECLVCGQMFCAYTHSIVCPHESFEDKCRRLLNESDSNARSKERRSP